MNRMEALPFVGHCITDSMAVLTNQDMPSNARLIGWDCGFEPMFVAVWSCLNVRLDDTEAVELARDWLEEIDWFQGETTEPDHIL